MMNSAILELIAAHPGSGAPASVGHHLQALWTVFTPFEAAEYLKISEPLLVAEAEAGRIPGQKIGTEWRFLKHGLIEWLLTAPSKSESRPVSSKARMLALAGGWKDDSTVDGMIAEMDQRRRAEAVAGK